MLVFSARAGSRPEYPKERRPSVCDPFASLRGKPAPGRLRGAPRNSLRCVAAPFGQPRRVRSRSTRAPTRVPPRNRPGAGAARRGWEPNSQTATRVIAALDLACAAPGASGGHQREALAPAKWGRAKQWPECMSAPHPLCMRRGAQRAGWRECRRTHAHRELTRRSCLSGAATQRSEFCGAPRPRAPQVAPAQSAGDADSWVALSLVTFFRRRERKLLARRATPGLRPKHKHAVATENAAATTPGQKQPKQSS